MGNATVEPDDGNGVGVTMIASGASGTPAAGCVAVTVAGAVVASGSSLEHAATKATTTTSMDSEKIDLNRIPNIPIIRASQPLLMYIERLTYHACPLIAGTPRSAYVL